MGLLRFGVGGLGLVCLGFAATMALGQSGMFTGASLEIILMAFAVAGASLGAMAMVRMAPAQAQAQDEMAPQDAVAGPARGSQVRLIPTLPGSDAGSADSWLGGCPMLPQGTEWPVIAGQPGQFLAQIDCAALPDTLWNGTGPRRGAMAFFRAARPDGADLPVRVLYVDGPLAMCPPPEGQELRPCWPLKVQSGEAGEDGLCDEPDWSGLHDVDPTRPGYQPFDWTSAAILLGRMEIFVKACAERQPAQAGEAAQAQVARTATGLAELSATVEIARRNQPFAEDTRQMLMNGLAALSLPETYQGEAKPVPLIRHRGVAQGYFAPFERHCRKIYAGNPEALPTAQRDLFEPFWAHNARYETGSIGADDLQTYSDGDASDGEAELLLELPSSELLGWMFGEGRALRIYAAPDDLQRGTLDRAWGSVAA